MGGVKSFDVSPTATEFTITGLEPASTYNVTLTLKDQMDGAWGVYSTLPPGWYLPRNLKHCDQTPFATSLRLVDIFSLVGKCLDLYCNGQRFKSHSRKMILFE